MSDGVSVGLRRGLRLPVMILLILVYKVLGIVSIPKLAVSPNIGLSTSFKSKPLTSSSLKNTHPVAKTAYSISPAAHKRKRSVDIGTVPLYKTPGANGRSIR